VQPTVISGTHPVGVFLTIRLSSKADVNKVAHEAARITQIVDDFTQQDKTVALPSVMAGVAFSPDVWEKIVKGNKKLTVPSGMIKYKERSGKYGSMPATGGDIFLHVKAESYSLAFETVKHFVEALPPGSVEKVEDWYGFQFQEGRDLSGFLDGTENPNDIKERSNAGVIKASDDPNHANGSYLIHQRWNHTLKEFHKLTEADQNAVIGRTRVDSAVLSDEKSPLTSHVRRMKPNSQSVKIVRQSMPYGTYNDHGLLFIAYSDTPKKFDTLLDRMVGKDDKHNDAVMSFSKCQSSQYYYVPSVEELKKL